MLGLWHFKWDKIRILANKILLYSKTYEPVQFCLSREWRIQQNMEIYNRYDLSHIIWNMKSRSWRKVELFFKIRDDYIIGGRDCLVNPGEGGWINTVSTSLFRNGGRQLNSDGTQQGKMGGPKVRFLFWKITQILPLNNA